MGGFTGSGTLPLKDVTGNPLSLTLTRNGRLRSQSPAITRAFHWGLHRRRHVDHEPRSTLALYTTVATR